MSVVHMRDTWMQEGQLVMAKVQSANGQGIWCWLANGAVATAALTELHDAFVSNALEGFQVGKFVRAMVAKVPSKGGKLKLSLRSSQGAVHSGTYPSVQSNVPGGFDTGLHKMTCSLTSSCICCDSALGNAQCMQAII